MINRKMATSTMVIGAILTALVIVLQYFSMTVKVGPAQLTLVLVPIIIGAATCGWGMATWLGFMFGIAVLITGAGEPFFTINPLGTIVTVLVKGTACGLLAGLTYKALKRVNQYFAVLAASVVCPVVNTGIFLLLCPLFWMDTIKGWAEGAGFGDNVVLFMFVGLAGMNFLVELLVNIVLNPVITRLLNYKKA
ncbi:MAG: ECF transporter S component [Monoglobales bacterium]